MKRKAPMLAHTIYETKNNYVPGIVIAAIGLLILLLVVLLQSTPSHYKPNKIETDYMVILVDGHRFTWSSWRKEWRHDEDCPQCRLLKKEAL